MAEIAFISVKQMTEWALDFISTIPNVYDMVVGVPRSGMWVASLVAAKFGRPLSTPDVFPYAYDRRRDDRFRRCKRVLVVDDTISSGESLAGVMKVLREQDDKVEIDTAAVLTIEGSKDAVTYSYRTLEHPRMFEWNIAHGKWGTLACDIDGVVCRDLPLSIQEAVMEEEYVDWITNAAPQFVPYYAIDVLVTCRMEPRRMLTEDWLARNHVTYKRLIMWDIQRAEERNGMHADWKINRIKDSGATYVFESDEDQAERIHRALGLPVLCFNTMRLLGGRDA